MQEEEEQCDVATRHTKRKKKKKKKLFFGFPRTMRIDSTNHRTKPPPTDTTPIPRQPLPRFTHFSLFLFSSFSDHRPTDY
jgi:hypothetical protein